MDLQEFLSRLENVKHCAGGYTAQCPNHDDKQNSLSITSKDGKILLNCFTGCETEDILTSMGLTYSDLHEGPKQHKDPEWRTGDKRPVIDVKTLHKKENGDIEYPYPDADGTVRLKKVRQAGKKDFIWKHRNSNGNGSSGAGENKARLYNLHEIARTKENDIIVLVEGEKDADSMTNLGFVATTAPNGAGTRWADHPEFVEPFKGRRVLILPDNDKPGRDYAENAAKAISQVAKVRIVDLKLAWPELPEKGDVSDFIEHFHPGEALKMITAQMNLAKNYTGKKKKKFLKMVDGNYYNTSHIPEIEWMIKDILPNKGLAQLSAKPKAGKTFFAYELALACVTGGTFLGSKVKQGTVIFLDLETPERGRQERLMKLSGGCIPKGIVFVPETEKICDGFLEQLDDALEKYPDTVLVIVDTIKQLRSQKNGTADQNLHDAEEIGALAKFVHDRDILMLCTNHLKKENTEDPFDSSLGSISINGALDTMLVLTQRQNEMGETTERMLHVKGREVEEEHYRMEFNDCRWSIKAKASEFSALENREEFFTNPIVKTVQMLLSESSEWKGKSFDLKAEIARKCSRPYAGSSQALTSELKALHSKFISYCGIDYEAIKHKKTSTIHHFYAIESKQELDEAQEQQAIQELISEDFEEIP